MRGSDSFTESLFSIKKLDDLVPASHPLRTIRAMVNDAPTNLEDLFAGMYEDAARAAGPASRHRSCCERCCCRCCIR
jgi:hypothetical protein